MLCCASGVDGTSQRTHSSTHNRADIAAGWNLDAHPYAHTCPHSHPTHFLGSNVSIWLKQLHCVHEFAVQLPTGSRASRRPNRCQHAVLVLFFRWRALISSADSHRIFVLSARTFKDSPVDIAQELRTPPPRRIARRCQPPLAGSFPNMSETLGKEFE